MIRIRNVPGELHCRLKARAAMQGMSLSDYLLREIREVAEHRRVARAPPKPVAGDTHTLTGTGGARRTPVIVLDAPAALEVLLRPPAAADVEERLFKPGETLHAPHMIDVEVAQVLRRYATAGQIARERQHGAR